ncbi:hypothetical protein JW758_02110 [Candidatus Peregrinibacteria bacterium]|nr:hypothetical protein [Candidatus Peregrinibacteria bacterium]
MTKERNIKLFYIHELFFQFNESMLAIVLPIFIYKLFDSISAVFLFTFVWGTFYFIFFIPTFNLAMKLKNPKYFMALGIIFYIIALTLFGKTTQNNINLMYLATLFFAMYITFYWMVRHWFFSVNSDYTKIGKQISTLNIIKILIGFIAPIVGGFLSLFVSFNASFVLGAGAGILSLIPILLFNAPPHPRGYNIKKIIGILKKPELKAISPTYFWEGIGSVFINWTWVLIFAIFIGNILDLGILFGVSTLAIALTTWLSGNWFDKRKRTTILKQVVGFKFLSTLLYTSVFLFPNIIFVWAIEFANRISTTALYTVSDSYLYAYSNKIHPIHFHLNREIWMSMSRISSAGILAIIFYFLPAEYLWISIAIGAFSYLGWLTLKNSDHLLN